MIVANEPKRYAIPKPVPPRSESDVVSVDVADLRDHPRLAEYLRDGEDGCADSEAMAGGEPIEILENGTIVCGQERVAAARRCGQQTMLAIIRRDLNNDAYGAELVIARDRLLHLGLSRTELARHYLELLRDSGGDSSTTATGLFQTTDRIARVLGINVTDLSDAVIALAAPAAVRDAYDAGVVSARQAARVAQLPPEERAAIEEAVRAVDLAEARQVITDHLEAAAADGRDPAGDYLALVDQLLDVIREVIRFQPPSHIDPIRFAASQYTLEEYGHYVCGFGDRSDEFDAREWLNRLQESESEDCLENT